MGAVTKRRAFPLLLALLALVLAGASVPHLHTATEPGLWNHDHDLSLMAALGSHACEPEAMPALGPVPTAAAAPASAPAPHAAAPSRPSAPRAPPLT